MTAVMTTILAAMLFAGCGSETKNAVDTGVAEELTILAAASLTDVCNEIKTEYEAAHPNVTLNFSYGASGALQTQIEEGAPARPPNIYKPPNCRSLKKFKNNPPNQYNQSILNKICKKSK